MDVKRLMIECRYLLSLDKNYRDLSCILGVNEDTIKHDLNVKLKDFDLILYERCQKKLKSIIK